MHHRKLSSYKDKKQRGVGGRDKFLYFLHFRELASQLLSLSSANVSDELKRSCSNIVARWVCVMRRVMFFLMLMLMTMLMLMLITE